MKSSFNAVKAMIFPKKCIFCGSLMFESRKNTCDRCTKALPYVTGRICVDCGCEKKDCSCTGIVHYYDRIAAPLYYENEVRDCIHKIKFGSRKKYAENLAEYMYDAMRERFDGEKFDFIAYVPLFNTDLKYRGYNQSEIMARRISEITGIPVKNGLIKKIYKTDKQSRQSVTRRTGNVMGAFDVSEDISGCSVLLIDDIKTSGSTLSECGKMLYLNGAENVCCLCAAVVRFKDKR